MNEFERDYKNNENLYESDVTHNTADENTESFTWYEDDYRSAISGTVSEKNALSIYKPKVKKARKKHTLLAAVISSVVTTAICFGIFSALLLNGAFGERIVTPQGGTLSVEESGEGIIKPMVSDGSVNAMSIPQIYDTVSPSVVSIISTGGNGIKTAVSSGSGVILTEDGYVVTNNHVIDGASIITVKTIAGQSLDAKLVGKDAKTDLAVLKVSCDKKLPAAAIGDSAKLRVGDLAVAIGNPLQEELVSTLTVGYISAINRTMIIDKRQMTMLQTDAAINPGNSGGALINAYGQVIGITTAKSTGYDVEGLGFAIPMNEAVPIIESIIKNGYVTGRPLVGIQGIDVTEQIAAANDLPIGVYVDSVISGGAADVAGVKKGDVIIECNGEKIQSVDEINQIRDKHKVGDTLKFTLSRNGSKVKVNVVLQEEKPTTEAETQKPQTQKQYIPSDFFSFFGW